MQAVIPFQHRTQLSSTLAGLGSHNFRTQFCRFPTRPIYGPPVHRSSNFGAISASHFAVQNFSHEIPDRWRHRHFFFHRHQGTSVQMATQRCLLSLPSVYDIIFRCKIASFKGPSTLVRTWQLHLRSNRAAGWIWAD